MAANLGILPAPKWDIDSDWPGIMTFSFLDATWQVQFPESMSPEARAFATSKKWWHALSLIGNRLSWETDYNDNANALRANMRELQAWILYCSRVSKGMQIGSAFSIGGTNFIQSYAWDIQAVGTVSGTLFSGFIRCTWHTGDPDPRAISTSHLEENTSRGPGDPKTISVPNVFALPNFGILKISAPSVLQYHHGLVVYAINCPDELNDGDTFELITLGRFGQEWDELVDPDDTDPIRTAYHVHTHIAQEPLIPLRDGYPLHVIPWTFEIALPMSGEWELSPTQIVVPHDDSGNLWVRAWKVNGDGENYEVINPAGLIKVENAGGATHRSFVDMDALDLTGAAAIRIKGFIQSADASALTAGQNRCKHDTQDFSLSWGADGPSGGCFHCALRTVASAALADQYQPGACFHTTCDQYLRDPGATSPMDGALLNQICFGIPWKISQQVEGFAYFVLERTGAPSLSSLVGLLADVPEGFHILHDFTLESGGFAKRAVVDGVLVNRHGLQLLESTGAAPDLREIPTWLQDGPGGNIWTREYQYPGDNDQQRISRSQLLGADSCANPYTLNVRTGTLGKFQRFRAGYPWLFHNLRPNDGTSEYSDGTFSRGIYTVNGSLYTAKSVLLPIRHNRATDISWGGPKRTFQIRGNAVFVGDYIALYAEHGQMTASTYLGSNQIETERTWLQGGGAVALREDHQVRNWRNNRGFVGSDHHDYVEAGDVAGIQGQPAIHRLWILDAQACYGGGGPFPTEVRTGSWKYAGTGGTWPIPGYYTLTLPPGRQLQDVADQIVLKRDSVINGDQLVTLTYNGGVSGGKPYDLLKDEYWYQQIVDPADSNRRIVYILVSHLNDTTNVLDRYLTIYFKSEEISDGSGDATNDWPYDISLEAPQGWANVTGITITVSDSSFLTIQSVTVIAEDGEHVLTAQASWAGHFADLDPTKYKVQALAANSFTFWFPVKYAGDSANIRFNRQNSSAGESAWYDANVAIHFTLPAGHKSWSPRRDRILIYDPTGHWKAAALNSPAWFDGKVLDISNDGVFLDDGSLEAEFREGGADGNILVFGADGTIYHETAGIADDVSYIGTGAVRNWEALAAEADGLVSCLESILEGMPVAIGGILLEDFTGIYDLQAMMEQSCEGGGLSDTFTEGDFVDHGTNPKSFVKGDSLQATTGFLIQEATAFAHLQLPINVFRIAELDRLGHLESHVGECKANLAITGASCRIGHEEFSVIDDGENPIPGGGSGYYEDPVTGALYQVSSADDAGKRHMRKKYYSPAPETIELRAYLAAVVRVDDEWKLRIIGGGGVSGVTVANDNASEQLGVLDISDFIVAYMRFKDHCSGFIQFVLPSDVSFIATSLESADTIQALMSILYESSFSCSAVAGDEDPPQHYITGNASWKEFEWGSLIISGMNISLTGDVALPAEARVHPYFIQQD